MTQMTLTRAERITKLANAVRDLRGVDGFIKRSPRPAARYRVTSWLERLLKSGDEIREAMRKIESFKTYDEFQEWVKML